MILKLKDKIAFKLLNIFRTHKWSHTSNILIYSHFDGFSVALKLIRDHNEDQTHQYWGVWVDDRFGPHVPVSDDLQRKQRGRKAG